MPSTIESQPIDALSDATDTEVKRIFPASANSLSYADLAAQLTEFYGKPFSASTIKNNWLGSKGRVTRLYDGLNVLPLKTKSGLVTPFGIAAVAEFAQAVVLGNQPYDDYAAEVRNRYQPLSEAELDAIAEKLVSEPVETVEPGSAADYYELGGAIVPSRREQLATLNTDIMPLTPTYKHVDTSDNVRANESQLAQFLGERAQWDSQLVSALAQQAVQEGSELGSVVAKLKIAAIESKVQQEMSEYAKKQGLEQA